jgi:4-amino-4-deoxy-L-arabinose transferase-like glycosyltransferase
MSEAERARAADRDDVLFAAALGVAYVSLLVATAGSVGYARDEGFYAHAARGVEAWFDLVGREGVEPFARPVLDHHFGLVHEHPGLMKTLMALCHRYLHLGLGLFAEGGTAYRFPAMVLAGVSVAVLYLWGRETAGRAAGVVAALSFALMPRVFFHAHLAGLDVPSASMWLVVSYLYHRSISAPGRVGPAIATGLVYGLFLNTKHNAWLLPFALVLHLVAVRIIERVRRIERVGPLVPHALVSLGLLGPLVFYAIWPWIWFSTGERLAEWVRFHLGHDYYNMAFLGHTYWKPPMPRGYAWVMTIATVPAVTLVLFLVGAFDSLRAARAREHGERLSTDLLWGLGLLVSYAPWWSSSTPIFGGTKHWITAYPFLCLFAARGFSLACARIALLKPALTARPLLVRVGVGAACLVGPLVMALRAHPYGLSFYGPIIGGVPGAASLGLNRGFWGYTTGSLVGELNERAPPGAGVYLHDTAVASWELLREDGRVRPDLRGTLAIHASSLALYHHEEHMRRVEYQVWVDYGTVAPVAMQLHDGVPIVWLYQRPR